MTHRRAVPALEGEMNKHLIVVTAALLMAALAACPACLAQTAPKRSAPEERQEQKDARAARITERIELVIARFDNNKERHVAAYNAAKARLKEAITELAEKGYDVTRLTADLQAWDGMFVKFAQDYATLINLLRTAEQYAPYESQGQFAAAIQQARAQLVTVRQDALDIRHYYQTVIRPDLQALKDQNPSSSPASSGT